MPQARVRTRTWPKAGAGSSTSSTTSWPERKTAARMGAELALKEYNDKGGYQGKPVGAVIYDDETKQLAGLADRCDPHVPVRLAV